MADGSATPERPLLLPLAAGQPGFELWYAIDILRAFGMMVTRAGL